MLHVVDIFPAGEPVIDYDYGTPVTFGSPAYAVHCPYAWRLDDIDPLALKVPGITVRMNRETGAIYDVDVLSLGRVHLCHSNRWGDVPVVDGVPVCDVSSWDPDSDLARDWYHVEEGPYRSYLLNDSLIIAMREPFEPKLICRAGRLDFVVDSSDELAAFVVRELSLNYRGLAMAGHRM